MEKPWIFGAAYYEEYLPCDRLEQDMDMMAEAGFTAIRIAESTWSVEEPRPGEYDFSHVDRVIDAAEKRGIGVIVGTPTYAVPAWLVREDPAVLAQTRQGQERYGRRQNMDITNPTYLRYAEGVIRALVSHTAPRKNVIGFQIDNETKHYDTSGPEVLARFRRWMAERYGGDAEAMNRALGLNYWSNSVTGFDLLPDPRGTINASYAGEFDVFRRQLAAEFLLWQSGIVREYLRPDQFITHNFDFYWRVSRAPAERNGFSYGVQPDICHFDAIQAVTLPGTDIYCPAQDRLTGAEIAFGGDLIRSLRRGPYLVLESQAQAFKEWLPYPGQLTLMTYSHLASGAAGQMYWNWFSIHNAVESYWKGILSHDFLPGPAYGEISALGKELGRLAPELAGLKKDNKIALVVSNESLTALDHFPTDAEYTYNDTVRAFYDALYRRNLECDVIFDRETDWSTYRLLIFPSLYCAGDGLIRRVRDFVAAGGAVLASYRSFFADERAKIRHEAQPYGLTDLFGMSYSQFTRPEGVTVDGAEARYWMELLTPATAQTVARYSHKYWGSYAAVTRNEFGRGRAWYLGTALPGEALEGWLTVIAADAGLAAETELHFPLIFRAGLDSQGRRVGFLLNYSGRPEQVSSPFGGRLLRTGERVERGQPLRLPDWGVCVLREE